MYSTTAWKIGCGFAGVSVILGAFGAHGLKKRFQFHPEGAVKLRNWQTAVQYQFFHSLAILAYSIKSEKMIPIGISRFAPVLFTAGTVMFCGSMYLLVLETPFKKVFGPITPLGGLLLIGGWISAMFL
jgi:uncharacterized membrane protein YgdD (TMEM256/DUF423 family)